MFSSLIVLFLICLTVKLLKGFWTCYLGYKLGFGVKWRSGDNVWAVITGATDGIGLEYAKQLAAKRYSLLLISRNEEKLKYVAQQIKEQFPGCKQIKIVAVNFERNDIYGQISNTINSIGNIDVLVNNVGCVYEKSEYFTNIPKEYNDIYFNCNMLSMIRMTEIILPKMVEQRRGIIINIGSLTSIIPSPLASVYSASKAFVIQFSKALAVEYESKGIVIQAVCPNFVSTKLIDNFHSIPMVSYNLVTSEEFVSSAIKTVGIEWITFGHWKHKLWTFFLNLSMNLVGEKICVRNAYKLAQQSL